MERFTEKLKDGKNIIREGIQHVFCSGVGTFFDGEAVDKLAEYEDLEEQGKLPKLPCAVGDTAWLVGDKRVLDYKVSGFSMDDSGISIIFIEKEIDGKIYSRSIDYTEYGKTVFLTKEKAEAALK